jgi:hypothetical protein
MVKQRSNHKPKGGTTMGDNTTPTDTGWTTTTIDGVKVIYLDNYWDSGQAYDLCMCNDAFPTGTVFVVEYKGMFATEITERIVGISFAWPIAITKEYGDLHYVADGKPETFEGGRFAKEVAVARKIMAEKGWE